MTAALPWLSEPVATLAWCWRLERCDGVTIGLTAHDRPLVIDGLTYAPAPGLKPAAMRLDDDWDGDRLEVEGAITSDRIASDDLRTGRWDGALVTVLMADWTDAASRHHVVVTGILGPVSSRGAAFSAEVNASPLWLDAGPVAPVTSPTCRAQLGDADCRVDMCGRVQRMVAVAVDGPRWTIDHDLPPGVLDFGRVTIMDGPACGTEFTILSAIGRELTLSSEPGVAVQAPIRVIVREGCDRRLATCSGRFANAVNFRGEPHLPGTDILTRYPGG